jgi:hypothetical protein
MGHDAVSVIDPRHVRAYFNVSVNTIFVGVTEGNKLVVLIVMPGSK